MKTYSTSILYGSDPILLEFITIDDTNVTHIRWTSPFGITSNEVVIPKKYIRKIEIKNDILGCKIIITFHHFVFGVDDYIIAKYFKKSDGQEIKRLLI